MRNDSWSKQQLLAAIKLYLITSFGKIHSRNPDVVRLANEIGRTPSAVALKMVNFASLDPTIDRRGMKNVSRLDREVWDEFFANIDQHLEDTPTRIGFEESDLQPILGYDEPSETEAEYVGPARRGQNIFRNMILASYAGKCAVTGIMNPNVLIASHIAPWATHPHRRLDPRNGICLNALHDRAFDRGLISFDEDLKIIFSHRLMTEDRIVIGQLGSCLHLPEKFSPDMGLIRSHRQRFEL